MRVVAILAALGCVAAPLGAGVRTRASDGGVRVEARAAPLSDVLDDLARQTGMKVVYEGAPPRDLITATLERGSLVEALLAVFEGLGLTYVIQFDAAGTGVAKLVMVANGSRAGTPAGPGPGRMSAPARPVDEAAPDLGDPEPDPDPSTVERDRVVTDPHTGEPYATPPDNVPADPPQPPAAVHVQGYPTPPGGFPSGPPSPFQPFPQGFPSPQPQPTPAAP